MKDAVASEPACKNALRFITIILILPPGPLKGELRPYLFKKGLFGV